MICISKTVKILHSQCALMGEHWRPTKINPADTTPGRFSEDPGCEVDLWFPSIQNEQLRQDTHIEGRGLGRDTGDELQRARCVGEYGLKGDLTNDGDDREYAVHEVSLYSRLY